MVSFDEKLGIIRSVVSGVQSAEDAHHYMADLQKCADQARARHLRVLHLVDARTGLAQPASTNAVFADFDAETAHLGVEKVAVIIHSVLLKMQSRRLYNGLEIQIFDTEDDALAWLLAE